MMKLIFQLHPKQKNFVVEQVGVGQALIFHINILNLSCKYIYHIYFLLNYKKSHLKNIFHLINYFFHRFQDLIS